VLTASMFQAGERSEAIVGVQGQQANQSARCQLSARIRNIHGLARTLSIKFGTECLGDQKNLG
jgi:hypothetical protein